MLLKVLNALVANEVLLQLAKLMVYALLGLYSLAVIFLRIAIAFASVVSSYFIAFTK